MSRRNRAAANVLPQASRGLTPPEVAAPAAVNSHPRRLLRPGLFVSLLLAALTLAALGRACGNGFIDDFDDDEYVTQNPAVQAGLTGPAVRWALTAFHSHNWHPLTWLSLEADTSLWGNAPQGYHRTNVLLHTANVLLLFGVLRRMTGALWRSAAVAALFAVHPLHVESVAWISERKDVLSALFFLLTLWAYTAYARRPGWGRYLLVVLPLALGLAAKPMLVTLPFVLLLLDYWPLQRGGEWRVASDERPSSLATRHSPLVTLLLEKLPLLILAAACSAATLAAQERIVQSMEDFPLLTRAANAVVACATYLVQAFWPVRLAFFYPHPAGGPPAWQLAGAALLLAGVSALVLRGARRHGYLPVGWLWYLGMLVPVIGLVQVGLQAHADRYTYLPLIGVFLMLAWGVPDLLARWHVAGAVTAAGTVVLVGVCAVMSWLQAGYWKDSVTLWRHALDVTVDNYMAHHKLGMHLLKAGQAAAARRHFEAAVRIQPRVAASHAGLGLACERLGRTDDAIRCYDEALRLNPRLVVAQRDLAALYASKGELEPAAHHYREALALQPAAPEMHNNLGAVYARMGRFDEAAQQYRIALKGRPDNVRVRLNLCQALARQGKLQEAVAECELARQACQSEARPRPELLDALAAAYAEFGLFPQAVATAQQALARASADRPDLVAAIRERLRLYQQGKPWRAAPPEGR
jgi:Flp pilus assembly protein TadD